jgi:hypothetical protein
LWFLENEEMKGIENCRVLKHLKSSLKILSKLSSTLLTCQVFNEIIDKILIDFLFFFYSIIISVRNYQQKIFVVISVKNY